jgi:hypothetical protein
MIRYLMFRAFIPSACLACGFLLLGAGMRAETMMAPHLALAAYVGTALSFVIAAVAVWIGGSHK